MKHRAKIATSPWWGVTPATAAETPADRPDDMIDHDQIRRDAELFLRPGRTCPAERRLAGHCLALLAERHKDYRASRDHWQRMFWAERERVKNLERRVAKLEREVQDAIRGERFCQAEKQPG